MKLFVGIITLLSALIISAVAGYFSVVGLGLLFAAAFWPVVIMGASLEAGKLVAASWLKANWSNPRVSLPHKLYLMLAVAVLMMITALGIYGYLAKGHLEQEAPLASVELQIEQIENRMRQYEGERLRLEQQIEKLDQTFSTVLSSSRNQSQARVAETIRKGHEAEREALQRRIDEINLQLNELAENLVPLRLKVSDVSAKLGPLKYVAQLFGWDDTSTAVQLVIIMIMIAFDPLAVMLVLSGTISIGDWMREKQAEKAAMAAPAVEVHALSSEPVRPTEPVPEPVARIEKEMVPAPWPEFSFGSAQPAATFANGWKASFGSNGMTVVYDKEAMRDAARRLDKETMIEILERNPDFIQEVIDAITPAEQNPEPPRQEQQKVEDALTWFSKPWFPKK